MNKIATLSFTEALRLGWKNKFKCAGRTRRSEFWWNMLPLGYLLILGSIVAFIVFLIIGEFYKDNPSISVTDTYSWIAMEAFVLVLVAVFYIPLLVRRLHDVGKSGRWAIAQSLFGWTLPLSLSISYLLVEYVLEKGRFPFVRKGIQDFWDCLHAFLTYVSPFCAIIGIVITIYLCVLCVRDSQKEENQYGPSPKYQS